MLFYTIQYTHKSLILRILTFSLFRLTGIHISQVIVTSIHDFTRLDVFCQKHQLVVGGLY